MSYVDKNPVPCGLSRLRDETVAGTLSRPQNVVAREMSFAGPLL